MSAVCLSSRWCLREEAAGAGLPHQPRPEYARGSAAPKCLTRLCIGRAGRVDIGGGIRKVAENDHANIECEAHGSLRIVRNVSGMSARLRQTGEGCSNVTARQDSRLVGTIEATPFLLAWRSECRERTVTTKPEEVIDHIMSRSGWCLRR